MGPFIQIDDSVINLGVVAEVTRDPQTGVLQFVSEHGEVLGRVSPDRGAVALWQELTIHCDIKIVGGVSR